MSTSTLLLLGGLAAVAAGILIAVYNVLEYLFFSDYAKTAQSAGWFPFQVMGVVAIALALLGLTALYTMQAPARWCLWVCLICGCIRWIGSVLQHTVDACIPGTGIE